VTPLRVVLASLLLNLKLLSRSPFFLLSSVVVPVLLSTIAFYMFRAGQREGTLFYAALGSAVFGIWSSTLFGSGGVIQRQRWGGTLELLVSAPAPLILAVVGFTLGTATLGVYSLAATLLWGRFLFDVPFTIEHPGLFALAIPSAVLSLGLLGLIFATTFVLWRNANALSNMLEYGVLLITGMLVPLALLPGWVEPLAWLLAPTWGVRAIRDAALGGEPAFAIGMTYALGAAYLVIGTALLRNIERLARRRATLSLA
jgi:ABC-2 type transport system permease protein